METKKSEKEITPEAITPIIVEENIIVENEITPESENPMMTLRTEDLVKKYSRIITAEEAKEIGLVNQVTGDTREELMEAAKAMAMKIMKKGPVAITMAKMAINVGMDTDINTGLLFERVAQTVAFATDDRKEGTAAFLEKRDAHFTGR